MLTENFSRRTFLKSSAALSTLLGLGTIGKKAKNGLIPTAQAETTGKKQQFYNACPRNCYDTCSIVTTVEDGRITFITGNENNTYTKGRLCVKGNTYPRVVYSPDRIKYPMRQKGRGTGNWERISWDEAYRIIAEKILEIKEEYGNTLPICLNKYSGNFNILNYASEGMFSSIGYTTRAKEHHVILQVRMPKRLIWEQRITMTQNNLWMQNISFFGEPIRLGLLLTRCTLSNRQRKKEQSLLLSIR